MLAPDAGEDEGEGVTVWVEEDGIVVAAEFAVEFGHFWWGEDFDGSIAHVFDLCLC